MQVIRAADSVLYEGHEHMGTLATTLREFLTARTMSRPPR